MIWIIEAKFARYGNLEYNDKRTKYIKNSTEASLLNGDWEQNKTLNTADNTNMLVFLREIFYI